jgi:hypothetical protein
MDGNQACPYILLKNDTGTIELFVRAATEINYRHFDEAIALYNRLLRSENASGAERVYFLDMLA